MAELNNWQRRMIGGLNRALELKEHPLKFEDKWYYHYGNFATKYSTGDLIKKIRILGYNARIVKHSGYPKYEVYIRRK